MSDALADTSVARLASSLADFAFNTDGNAPPLFLLHAYLGGMLKFRRLAELLPSDQPVYGIHVHCEEGQIGGTQAVSSLAQHAFDRMRAIQPTGRITVAGHSAGGLIALEVARDLLDANEPEPRVLLIDTVRPSSTFGYYWAALLLNLPGLRDASTVARVGRLRRAWRRRCDQAGPAKNYDLVGLAKRNESSTNELTRRHRAQTYRGAITVMRTRQGRLMAIGRSDLGWGSIINGMLSLIDLRGGHMSTLEDPHVLSLAEKVCEWLSSEPRYPAGGNVGQFANTYVESGSPPSTSAHQGSPDPTLCKEASAVGRQGDLAVELARLYGGRRRCPRVLLFGNYGQGNLGDEGILASVLISLRPVADVTVVSRAPTTLSGQHEVGAVQMMSLRGVLALLRCDAVAIGGGGMFGNGINLITSLLPVIALLSQKLGKETLFLATGAYSSSPSWVQRCLQKVAASSVFVSVRDEESAAVLGRGAETVIVDDPAINLTPAPEDVARAALEEAGVRLDRPLLGISLKPTRYQDRNDAQVSAATAACEWWSRTLGGNCVLLCLSDRGDNGLGAEVSDHTLAKQVLARISVPESVHLFGPDVSPELMKAAIGQLGLVVGHRLHAQIYAWPMGVPLGGISYERKSDSFLEARRLKRIDLWTLRPEDLVEWISSMAHRALLGRLL